MKIKVIEQIKTRMLYPIESRKDKWLDEIWRTKPEECCIIVPDHELSDYLKIQNNEKLLDEYNVLGIYQLGRLYINTNMPMNLIHLSKKRTDFVLMGFFYDETFDFAEEIKNNVNSDELIMPLGYSETFGKYIKSIEEVIADKKKMGDTPYLKKVSIKDIDQSRLIPRYYTDDAMAVRKFLETEKTVKLSSIADVIFSQKVESSKVGKVIGYRNLKYPFDEEILKEGPITNCVAEKGDIILPIISINNQSAYLFTGSKEPVYVAQYMLVIKAKKVSPEYLYLYLSSDTAQEIFTYLKKGATVQKITKKSVQELPVILPTLEAEKYISDFNKLIEEKERSYQTDISQELLEYSNRLFRNATEKPSKIEDILNIELATKIKMHNEKQLRSFLTEDLKELNVCFREKAYKATLIMAGSILEAVLIDWLSEIHHRNYFETDYMITDRRGNVKRADLIDYIDAIKYIERPNWLEEAEKAHTIRKKRNLVHAKLCLKSDDVNEKVCKQVIGYLEDVLKTRGFHQKK